MIVKKCHEIVNAVQKQQKTKTSTWVLMKACKVKGRTINTIPQAELIFAEGKNININNCHISPWGEMWQLSI